MNSAPDGLQAELAGVLDELRETQAAIRALSSRVLLDPAAEEEAEPDRRAHLQRRRELLARITNIILRAVDAGAEIEIHAGMPDLLATATAREPPAAPHAVEIVEMGAPPPDNDGELERDPGDAAVEAVVEVPTDGEVELAPPPTAHDRDEERALSSAVQAPAATVLPDPARLQAALMPAWARRPTVEEPPERALDVALLAGILTRLGPPPTEIDEATLRKEVEQLAAEIVSSRLAEWTRLPKHIQRQLVAMGAARARHVQSKLPSTAAYDLTLSIARIFSALTRFSASEQPGFVVGLQRDHDPRGASWIEDAEEAAGALRAELPVEITRPKATPEKALELLRAVLRDGGMPEMVAEAVVVALDAGVAPEDVRLLDLLVPRTDELATVLASKARFKRLRRAMRERVTGDEDDGGDDATESDVPIDWSYWSATAGKRAVVIGGDLREEARLRLERAFRFASLKWITTDQIRGVQQLAQSIAGGSVDLVIVLARFMAHKIQDAVIPACKEAGVAWVVVEKGYGVTQVRLAIERFRA